MTLRPRDKAVLSVLAGIVAIAALYMVVLKPQRQRVTGLDAQITVQRQALTAAQGQLAAGKAAQSSLREHASDWAALRTALPNTSDIPALLRVLENTAGKAGVQLTSIQLSDGSSAQGSAASSTSSPGAVPATAGATSVPLTLSFSGGYREFDALVRRLNGLVLVSHDHVRASGPLLSISNVQLTGAKNLTVQVTADIYQLAGQPTTASDTSTGGSSS